MQITPTTWQPPVNTTQNDQHLKDIAQKFEASFLSEMLKSAGFGSQKSSFGGGAGEDQFSSFLVQAQAEKMAQAGGVGIAEMVFEALKEQRDGTQ
ncbi:MAG: rod-binding protein [Paracoccaceae bacterium]